MQVYKFLCVVVTIFATVIDIQIHAHSHTDSI